MAISSEQRAANPLSNPVYTPADTLSDTTRYLCAAAYLDARFGDLVVAEVLEDERRAVPPSFGFDLDPVVRHCLRARRILLVRDAVLTGLVVLGLLITPLPTICWMGIGACLWVRDSPRVRGAESLVRATLYAAIILVSLFAATLGAGLHARLTAADPAATSDPGGGFDLGTGYDAETAFDQGFLAPAGFDLGNLFLTVFLGLLLGFASFLVLLWFRRQSYEILVDELAPGRPAQRHAVPNGRIERRLGRVAAAQRGNITVQESYPFLGAGQVTHGWSFAVTLRPAPDADGRRADRTSTLPLDAVDLVEHVRAAVLRMRDSALPERERVAGLYLVPHVVADGVRGQEDPLLDPASQMPYSLASDEAVRAIIRTPQGGLRYYDRLVVPMSGKHIRTDDDEVLLPAQSLGCEVSVFVHLAVEGGRLYAELMATLLPPVRKTYWLADALNADRITSRSARDSLRGFVTDAAAAPWRLPWRARQSGDIVRRMDEASEDSQEFRAYDYGARFSVRELAAEHGVRKFLQALDGWKYVKLLDRTVSEAVIDFLTDRGVDTAEFRAGVTHVHSQFGSVEITGGQVNLGGANATFNQHNNGKVT